MSQAAITALVHDGFARTGSPFAAAEARFHDPSSRSITAARDALVRDGHLSRTDDGKVTIVALFADWLRRTFPSHVDSAAHPTEACPGSRRLPRGCHWGCSGRAVEARLSNRFRFASAALQVALSPAPDTWPVIRTDRGRRALAAVALIVVFGVAGACRTGAEGEPQTQPGQVVVPPQAWMPATPGEAPVVGVKWDWDRESLYHSYLRGLGGGDTFYELVWCDVEPAPGLRNWSRIDEVVDGAAALGFEMNLKIRIGSCWATGARLEARGAKNKTASLMPTDMAAYEAFVRAVVDRYAPRRVHRYAVENEVNGKGFWESSPADYERVVRTAAAAIRDTDPEAIVLDSGISSTAYGAGVVRWLLDQQHDAGALAAWNAFYERRFAVRAEQLPRVRDVAGLQAALRGEQPARNLAFLDATFRLAADGVVDAYQLHFYEPWSNVPLLLGYLRSHLPAGLPVESWETGIFWPGGDEEAVPGETVKLVSLLLAGGVRRVIWLPAAYDPRGRREQEYRFGLFDATGDPRPAATLFAGLARAAAGSSVRGITDHGVQGVALSRDERTVVAVWSDAPGRRTAALPVGTEVLHATDPPVPAGHALELDGTARLLTLPVGAEAALGLLR